MEQEQQQLNAPLEQQAINSNESLNSTSQLGSTSSATGGTSGEDPNEQARHFKMLSDTSIQAQEAAGWQTMANNSPQALEGAKIKASAAQKARNDSPQGSKEETGIPVNLQTSIEYMAKVSLKEVRVHYDSPVAVEEGVATMHDYPNVYVAPGKKKQLGEELWKIAHDLKKQQAQSTAPIEADPISNSDIAPIPTSKITNSTSTPATETQVTKSTPRKKQVSAKKPSGLEQINSNPLPEGAEYNSAKPIAITPKPLAKPSTDSGFKTVKAAINTEGDQQQEHQSSKQEVQEAQEAAAEPANKKNSTAQSQHLEKVETQETPAFESNAFVEALMQKVQGIMPSSEKEADEFKKSGKMKEVKHAVAGTVATAKQGSVAPLEEINKQPPSESGIASKSVTPLAPADLGRTPQDIQADKAVPKPLNKDRVEQPLQNNVKALDEQMASNGITDEQLEKSNEPTFQAALESKNAAKEDGKNKEQQARSDERQQINKNQQDADQLGEEQMNAMHQDRSKLMTGAHHTQEQASSSYTTEEQAVADKISSIYTKTKSEVESRLSRLDKRVQKLFDQGADRAQHSFEAYVESKVRAYKAKRYEGISGKLTQLGDFVASPSEEINEFFRQGRRNYISQMKRVIQGIAQLVARELNSTKKRVQTGRQQIADYVQSLPCNLQKVGKKAAKDIDAQFAELNNQVDAKQEGLIDTLAKKYTENINKIDQRIEALKKEHQSLLGSFRQCLVGPWEDIKKVSDMLTGVLNAARGVIKAILLNPIDFLNNLIDGVKQGFGNFLGNIQENMTTGFVEWLTGSLGKSGIQMPSDVFSLEGIFSIVTQALNLTWDFVRERAVKHLGEDTVKTLEGSFEVFQVIQEKGMAGAWEYLQDEFNDLKETVMDSITGMLISEVITAGTKWILAMLSPAGAFLKAAMLIVDIAQFFINQGSQLVELVNAFTASMSAIAAGNLGQVATSIETALKLSVPILIGFMAALLGIGNLAKKVQKIFNKIKGKIVKTIDGLITKAGKTMGKKKKKNQSESKKKSKTDKRNDKEKNQAVKKGLQQGAKVINNKNLNIDQIKNELQKVKRTNQLETLEAKLTKKTEQLHTFILESRIGKKREKITIERPPTKADKESQVNAKDRALHERFAAEIKTKLEAKEKSTKSVETFEAFYDIIRKEAIILQKEYQPKLRDGIKIAVELVNAVAKDKKDGDVDFKINIAPNTTKIKGEVEFNDNNQLSAKVLHEKAIKDYNKDNKIQAVGKKEDRRQEIIGYEVNKDGKKGYAVARSGEGNKFTKSIKGNPDNITKEFKTLQGIREVSKRKTYIQQTGDGQTNAEKIEDYDLLLKIAGASNSVKTKIKNPSQPTDTEVKNYRHEMQNLVCNKYKGDIKGLDTQILHNSQTKKVNNKIFGNIFEQWIKKNIKGDINMTEVVFDITDKNGKVITRKSDGMKGNMLVEAKSVTGKPSSKDKDQMKTYRIILDDAQGFSVERKTKDIKAHKKFKGIQYYFSNEEAALLWKPNINKIFKYHACMIYIGDELLSA